MNLKQIVGCAALALVGAVGAQAQVLPPGWFDECHDHSTDPPPPQYSNDYGINAITNGLFGASMGVSGNSTWGGPQGPCWTPARVLDAAGRLSFFMGTTGSVQSTFDDGLALSMGAPTDPVGDFCFAIITKDDNTLANGVLFGDGGLRLAYTGASKRYMVGAWTDGEVDVALTVRNIGDAAILWWEYVNLGTEPRPFGLLFGIWGAQRTSFGQFDSQTGADQFFALLGTNFGTPKLTLDNFTGYFVTPTTRPIRNDHRLARTSPRFPNWVQFLAGQTEAYGLHLTNVPDATMAKLSPDPLNANQFIGASTADLIRIGDHFFTLWNNNLRFNVFGDPTGTQEEADVFVFDHSVAQRYPVRTIAAGQRMKIIQVIKSSWGVSNYNDPYAAVVDAPRMINMGLNGELTPNPMTIRAYIDNQYAELDKEVAMQSVRMIISLPTGLSLAPGETQEKILGQVNPNAIGFVEWQVESDGVTFGELPVSVTFAPVPGPQRTLTATVRIAATPIIRIASGAQMVTFPYQFPDNNIGTILGLTPEIDFRAYKYDSGQGAYLQATVANRGESFWIVPTSDQGFITLANASIPTDTPTGGLLYTLHKGWNMIGNPYNYAVPLADLVAVVEDAPAESYSWQELVSQGFVSSALAYWDRGPSGAGVGSYKFTTSQSTKLEPHKGYWIYVNTFNVVRLSWPPVLIPGLANAGRADDSWRQSERQYRVQLSARMAGGADTDNYVGYVADTAASTRLQLPKPPSPQGGAVEVAIEGQIDGQATRMAQALTNVKTKTEFRVHVTNKESGDVTVTWPNLASVPRNVRVKITDVATGEVRDMRAVSGYTYFMAQPGTREFVVSMEQGGSVRPVIGNVIVGQAGNRGDSPMTIRYALSADAMVSVRVLSASGKEVFTVTRGRADNAGENEVVWSLRDNANRAVAPGQYRVEILAETTDGERVRRIVPVNVVR